MPWTTPTLREVRTIVRDDITASIRGVKLIGNSVMRVMADADAGLAHLVLRYIDWLARQLLPDTAETEWLDRHGKIWLNNADGTIGRKLATLASGTVTVTGVSGLIIPIGSTLSGLDVDYETTAQVVVGSTATSLPVRALTAGVVGNVEAGLTIQFSTQIAGVDSDATVVSLTGGVDDETDDALRGRVLDRIRKPPMGGDASDYVMWAESVAGVTRAWSYPLEMGMGTVTVRFMSDVLRANNDGFPTQDDVNLVSSYLDTVRPVAVKDFFVEAPIRQEIEFTIEDLVNDDAATRAAIEQSVKDMLLLKSAPGQIVYHSWISEAISQAIGEDHHTLVFENTPMLSSGHMAVLGSIIYG